MSDLSERWAALQTAIARACERVGRHPSEITLVAVSKGVPAERIAEAYQLGVRDFGENYWQEAREKLHSLPDDIRWHFIGHLQTNKAKYVVGRFALIQSLDRQELLQEIQKRAQNLDLQQAVLVEVRLDPAESRAGVKPEEAEHLIEQVLKQPNLRLEGVMGVAPYTDDEVALRKAFQTLRRIYEQLPSANRRWLSMGMSHDFALAIEEGSTMVRIGTALFGERK
ncbi:MAG: YggS family pyridoxal phosphate-dependent enzyme [Fimbriimonadales bacterium]